jgi:uncharacterized membrane protein YhaH (DUF805 family)
MQPKWLDQGRDAYLAAFGVALGAARYVKSPISEPILRVIFAAILLVPFPYFVLRRIMDLRFSRWWTLPVCLVTFLAVALPKTLIVTALILVAIHAPLLLMRSRSAGAQASTPTPDSPAPRA